MFKESFRVEPHSSLSSTNNGILFTTPPDTDQSDNNELSHLFGSFTDYRTMQRRDFMAQVFLHLWDSSPRPSGEALICLISPAPSQFSASAREAIERTREKILLSYTLGEPLNLSESIPPICLSSSLTTDPFSYLGQMQESVRTREGKREITNRADLLSPEVPERMSGHEPLVSKVCGLATEEAKKHNLSVLNVKVRSDWAHEYEETAGIVVDVKIKATNDERFSYWEAVCERIESLSASLSPEEQNFLNSHLSLAVRRG